MFVFPEGLDLSLIAEDRQVLYVYELLQQDGVRPRLFHLMGEVKLNTLLVVLVEGVIDGSHLEVMRLAWHLIGDDLRP